MLTQFAHSAAAPGRANGAFTCKRRTHLLLQTAVFDGERAVVLTCPSSLGPIGSWRHSTEPPGLRIVRDYGSPTTATTSSADHRGTDSFYPGLMGRTLRTRKESDDPQRSSTTPQHDRPPVARAADPVRGRHGSRPDRENGRRHRRAGRPRQAHHPRPRRNPRDRRDPRPDRRRAARGTEPDPFSRGRAQRRPWRRARRRRDRLVP